jgi:hypothetical protein
MHFHDATQPFHEAEAKWATASTSRKISQIPAIANALRSPRMALPFRYLPMDRIGAVSGFPPAFVDLGYKNTSKADSAAFE